MLFCGDLKAKKSCLTVAAPYSGSSTVVQENNLIKLQISRLPAHAKLPTGIMYTVLQIQVYPKNNAPGVSKPQRVAKSDFLLILKIFLTLDDIRPGN